MMNCKAARRLIPALMDGELGPEKTALVNRHLSDCPGCRQEMASLQRTMQALEVRAGITPAFTLDDVRRRAAQRRLHPAFSWFPPLPRLAYTAMVLAAVAVGGVSGAYHGSRNVQPASPPPTASARSVSDSLGLDAFDNGLDGAVRVADAGNASADEVTQ